MNGREIDAKVLLEYSWNAAKLMPGIHHSQAEAHKACILLSL